MLRVAGGWRLAAGSGLRCVWLLLLTGLVCAMQGPVTAREPKRIVSLVPAATQMLFAIGSEVETKLIHPAPKAYRRKGIAQGSPLRHVHHDSATCHQRQTKLRAQHLQGSEAATVRSLQQQFDSDPE